MEHYRRTLSAVLSHNNERPFSHRFSGMKEDGKQWVKGATWELPHCRFLLRCVRLNSDTVKVHLAVVWNWKRSTCSQTDCTSMLYAKTFILFLFPDEKVIQDQRHHFLYNVVTPFNSPMCSLHCPLWISLTWSPLLVVRHVRCSHY